jgi:hypothetical protein
VTSGEEKMKEGTYFVMHFTNELDQRRKQRYCFKKGKIFEAAEGQEEN